MEQSRVCHRDMCFVVVVLFLVVLLESRIPFYCVMPSELMHAAHVDLIL